MHTATTTTFEPGKSYVARWVTDSTLRTPILVVSRTAKFVTLRAHGDPLGETTRCKVRIFDGAEVVSPLGTYSMAPVLRADAPA